MVVAVLCRDRSFNVADCEEEDEDEEEEDVDLLIAPVVEDESGRPVILIKHP